MKLVTFSVTNYRSITKAHKIDLDNYTVLIGKNNEGKSNILKALKWSMEFLIMHSRGVSNYRSSYNWERDFPVQYQNRKNGHTSNFRLVFSLDDSELTEFALEIGSKINGNIAVDIQVGRDNKPEIKVPKQGKGATSLTTKSNLVANFISRRIAINYIPAVRTENHAINVIRETLAEELEVVERKPEYVEAMNVINNLQSSILDSIAEKITEPLKFFMPTINKIEIGVIEERRRAALRKDIEMIVDDGISTSIEFKGDGVKSLAALAMLKDRNYQKSTPVIAIEEPESHLHPSAIHQLNEVIMSLAETNQVIITTHNPLFVFRNRIRSNIIVDNGKAVPAKKINEIRELLGIKASDNLTNSSYVLVVEGDDDKITLNKLLPAMSDKIDKALKSNIFRIEEIGGAGNLSYKLSLLRNSLCSVHVLLDNDEAGRKAFENAEKDKLASIKNTTFTNCNGRGNTEFEDCLNPEEYKNAIKETFGVDINSTYFRGNEKWSDRVKAVFKNQGKLWNDGIEKEVKTVVANAIPNDPSRAFNTHNRDSIDALVQSLENLLGKN